MGKGIFTSVPQQILDIKNNINNSQIVYNKDTDSLDVYYGGLLVGSIKCNFENLPFNFIIDTTTADWKATAGTFSMASSGLTFKYAGSAKPTATYYTTIPITEGCTLNVAGNVKYSAGSASSNAAYSAQAWIQISKDGGTTWENLVTQTATAPTGTATKTATIAQTVDMSAYAGYDCNFRVMIYNTRASSSTHTILTLTEFNLTY